MKLNPEQRTILLWALRISSAQAYHLGVQGFKPSHCGLKNFADWEKVQEIIFSLQEEQK